jgi:TIGR01125: MiaB-like tRNA modifying enzyme YliG, TIGR01125
LRDIYLKMTSMLDVLIWMHQR